MTDEVVILYAVETGVCTITLNRPEKLNAWNAQMETDFRLAVERASADDEVRAIVVTGAGRGFCAGADLSGGGAPMRAELEPSLDDFAQRYSYLLRSPKPIVAAINGAAIGVGLCLTLYCDFRYAAEGAKIGTAFARRGLIAEHGAAWLLPRLMNHMDALDLLFTGRTIEASEAATMGLVRTLPASGFLEAVTAFARDLATNSSPRSMRVIKEQIYTSFRQTLAEAVTTADSEQLRSITSDDFREGVSAFLEKRPPAFSGL